MAIDRERKITYAGRYLPIVKFHDLSWMYALKAATDAVTLDSTQMTLDEALTAAEAIVAAKLGQTTHS